MKKKVLALLLSISMLFCVACSGNNSNSTSGNNSAENTGTNDQRPYEGETLTVLFMSGTYADAARELVVPEFEERTGAKVEIVDFPYASLHEKMLLDFTSGTASYDVVSVACQWDGEMAPFLEPLDSYIERDNFDVDDFDQNIWDNAGRWEGVTYGVPHANTPYTMAYRTDLVSEDELPTTWEEYLAIAQKYYDPENGMYGVAPAASVTQYGSVYYGRLWSLGGEWADENWNATLESEENRKALELSKQIIETADPACLSWGLAEASAAFAAGNAVFLEGWPTLNFWAMAQDPEQNKIGDNWALAPFPQEKTGLNTLSAWDISINAASEKKDLGWEFIKAYTDAETQFEIFQKFAILSPRISFWEREEIKSSQLYPLKDALSDSLIWWRIPASEEAKSEISVGMSAYFAGESTLEEAMAYQQEGVERALQNNPPPEGLLNKTAQIVAERAAGK